MKPDISFRQDTVPGSLPTRLLELVNTLLRGISQVMLQDNRLAGALFLAGIFYNSWLFGCGVLLGTAASTATALVLGVDRTQVRTGLFGFNGALVAIALLYFLEPGALTWAYVLLAAACSTVLMAALMNLLARWKLPVLTAPFVFITLLFVLAGARFGRLQITGQLPTAGLPKATVVEGVVGFSTIAEGLFNGIAQVFFQGNVITGVLFATGLLVASRSAFAAALAGSLAGVLVAWGMGAAEPAIRAGAFGFNPVLTAIALYGVFFSASACAAAYALLGTIGTAVVYAGVSAALEPLGMPALTLPFVLVTWCFVAAGPLFPRLRMAQGG